MKVSRLKLVLAVSAGILIAIIVLASLPPVCFFGIEEPLSPVSADTGLSAAFRDRVSWYGIYLGEEKIGWSRFSLKGTGTGPDGVRRFRMENEDFMKLKTMGVVQETMMTLRADFTQSLQPLGLAFGISGPVFNMKVDGVVENGRLKTRMTTPSGVKEEEFSLDEDMDLFGLADFRRAVDGYKVGDVIEGTLFNPQLFGVVPYRVEIYDSTIIRTGGAVTRAFRVRTIMENVISESLVAEDGEMIRTEGPMGIIMKREPEETARDMASDEALSEIYLKFAIPAGLYVENPAGVRRAVLEVEGAGDYEIASGGAQRVEKLGDGRSRVVVDLDAPEPAAVPDSERRRFLAPTRFIQSEDSRIVRAASEIVAAAQSPVEKVRLIADRVHVMLAKKATFSVPSAVDVLASREGDCNEHAALFAGLARAAGIPTRVAVGVAYLEGNFFYHAWNEVLLEKRWVPVDSTFGENPAGALRLRLASGSDLDDQWRIASLGGKIRVRILEHAAPKDGVR